MATIQLIHKRVGNDIGIALRILDSNVAIDWTTVDRVYASLVSDQQRVRLGQCKVLGPDSEDPTTLSLLYGAKNPQYLGLTRIVVEVTYHGHVSTFDKPVLVFVASTAEEGTYPVTVDIAGSLDPEDNNLEIEVSDVDTSVLSAAIEAAQEAAQEASDAADEANAAAESAGAFAEAMRGGTTGQVLTKDSDADGDYSWKDGGGSGSFNIHALPQEDAMADGDEMPFYDVSASAARKTVWSNIKAKLKAYFDTIYSTFSGAWGSLTGNIANQTDLKDALDAKQNVINDLSDIRSGAAAGATAYQKPSSGIPKTDMASAVQTSLGKADTALQPADISTLEGKVEAIEGKIPTEASSSNQLADKNFVNSSIATATATFKGTYNLVSDLLLTTSATTAQIAAALASAITGEDNNDYAFVQIPTADATPTEIARVDRYKFDGTDWAYEFSLNNSSFTAAQWAAINSGITAALVTAFGAKYDKPGTGIPKSDLAEGVQTSLGKADSALQSQAQSDWNEADNTQADFIKNKPTIPTVPTISTDIDTDKASDSKTASPKAVYTYVDNPVISLEVPTPPDGTIIATHLNGDTTTINLNHQHADYPKYYLCADETEYAGIATKDSSTLYLIPESSS